MAGKEEIWMIHKGELKMEIDNIVTEIKADLKNFCNGSNEKIADANSKIDKVNEIVKDHDKKIADIITDIKTDSGNFFSSKKEAEEIEKKEFLDFIKKGKIPQQKSIGQEEGKYIVPNILHKRIIQNLNEISTIRQIAQVMTVESSYIEFVKAGDNFTAKWIGDGEKREETEVQNFKKIRINIDEMYAKPVISQRVLDDNEINLDTWMFENVCQNISMLENAAFINGDGQKKPTGILKHERTQEKAEEFEKIQEIEAMLDDKSYMTDVIIAAIASMNPCYLKDACFLMNSKTLSYLRQLKDQNDNYVWQRQLTQGFPETLFGYKVHIVHEMDDIEKGKSPIAFGNFKHGYKIIDRKDITMIKDPYSAKPYVEFYMTKRVGGGVVNPAAIKLISIEKEKKKGGGK